MSALDIVAEKAFDLVSQGASVSVRSSAGGAIARALPSGSSADEWGPWSDQELRQVYYEQDPVTTSAVEIDFTISYVISAAGQYIDRVYADTAVKCPTPFSLNARIEFRDAYLDSSGLDVAVIPFMVSVERSHPILGVVVSRASGILRGDGTSSFDPFYTIEA
jgi:hypothetical protein